MTAVQVNNQVRHKWCAVDAEGDVGNKGLLGVAVYSDIHQGYHTDPGDIVSVLLDHAYHGYIFLCHNASYDVPVVWSQLGLHPEITIYNSRFHHASWKYDKHRRPARIWDTLDLSAGNSILRLGEALGIPKYPTPQKLLGVDPDKYLWKCELHDEWECEECYAVRDAEIVYRFMEGLTTTLAGWSVAPSARLSGIALDVWKSLDNPSDISLRDSRIHRMGRAAYYGGRTETFRLGWVSPIYTADVTSMYPSIMLTLPFPDPKCMIYVVNPATLELPTGCEGVAKVDISIPPMHIPPLPYNHKGERWYPIGRLIGTWTLHELRYAVSLGCKINKIYELGYAINSVYPFNSFVNVLWTMREEYLQNNDPRALFAKLLLNNLYGRLGARDRPEREILKEIPPGYDSKREVRNVSYKWINEQGYIIQQDTLNFGREWTNVLWAAQITAGARVKLHKLMMLQSDHLAYCDTDSIFSTKPIEGVGKGLGELKIEGEYKGAIIAQPKLYALQDANGKWYPKAKGVSREVAMDFIRGHNVTFSKPIKPKEALSRQIPAGTWVLVTKHRHPTPYRRMPVHPEQLLLEYGTTTTNPPVCGPLLR